MAARRRKAGARRRSRKKGSSGIPAWFWLLGGILIGLGTAVFLMFKGYLPDIQQHAPATSDKAPGASEAALLEDDAGDNKPEKPRYDFFTVLPEMEVVIPDQELEQKAKQVPEAKPNSTVTGKQDSYILQAGSFKNASDAEQRKARLAMMGAMASVQSVTVNGQTWHRVRIGPVNGARKADEMRRMLSDNRIDTLVMKVNP